MKIALGTGLFLGTSTGSYTYEIQTISGLESPELRNGNGIYAGEDGGYWVSQFFGNRTLVIRGFALTRCASEQNAMRKNFIDRLPIRYICPIVIEDFSESCWYLEGCITDVKSDLKSGYAMEYQITIVCSDPFIYRGTNLSEFSPVVIEENIELNGEEKVLPVEQGALYAYPTITVTGIYTTPITVTNLTSGEFITIDNTTTETTDKTIISVKNRAITLNGSTINDKMSIDSTWFKLNTGNNHLLVTSGDPINDTATVKVSYSTGFRGI